MELLNRRRKNTLALAIASLMLVVFLLIYSDTGSSPIFNANSTATSISEFYLLATSSRQFDESGQVDTTINSSHIKHNPADNSIQATAPSITIYDKGIAQWHISALSGSVFEEGDKIDLNQNVVIISSDQTTSLKTPQLFIYPSKKSADTTQAVTLLSPSGFTSAIGMQVNLESKSITLLNQVKGQYNPANNKARTETSD